MTNHYDEAVRLKKVVDDAQHFCIEAKTSYDCGVVEVRFFHGEIHPTGGLLDGTKMELARAFGRAVPDIRTAVMAELKGNYHQACELAKEEAYDILKEMEA
jgi:hypothetical protein